MTERDALQAPAPNEKDIVRLLQKVLKMLPIHGYKPEYLVVKTKTGEIYSSVKDTAEIIGLSDVRVKGLSTEGRVGAVKPGGHDQFISLKDAIVYNESGRKRPGPRPGTRRQKRGRVHFI